MGEFCSSMRECIYIMRIDIRQHSYRAPVLINPQQQSH